MAAIRMVFVFLLLKCSEFSHGAVFNVSEFIAVDPGHDDNVHFFIARFVKYSWLTSHEFCRSHKMHLAAITSPEENNQLKEAILNLPELNTEAFWTSGSDFPKKDNTVRTFFWESTGRKFNFESWHNGEPNDVTHNCVDVAFLNNQFGWGDTICNKSKYFICERRKPCEFIIEEEKLS